MAPPAPWERGRPFRRGLGFSERGGGRGGRGGGGGSSREVEENRGRKFNACRQFQQTRNCRFGAQCKFSHDLSSNSNSAGSSRPFRETPEGTSEQQRAKADYNSWKRNIKNPPVPNDTRTIERLWSGALDILNDDDRDWKHMLPRDLDDDDKYGREHIRALLTMVANNHGSSQFVKLSRPFLLVITHPALLDCLSVDTYVGGLYNFISGNHGTRAIPFFQRLSNSLLEEYLEATIPTSTSTLETTLIAMTTALCELLRREQRATFNEELPDLFNSLENIAEITRADRQSIAFQIVTNRIGELQAMVARANGLLNHTEEPQLKGISTTVVTSTYPRDVILPQGRHDNDSMDITRINILPTEDEIRSNHPEFMPSTDLDQPHFLADQAQRHLDTHFRLLRHDIFGELKEALGGLMLAVENNSTLLDNSKLGVGNIRAYPYPKAQIKHISFDHRQGLEAQISFPHPLLLRKKSLPEKRKWWEDSKRLEEGVLLCFVSLKNAKSSLLFFTTSRKCTDAKKICSLGSHDNQASISAKLATLRQEDVELMTHLSCHNARGVLIEFPGVLLATFIPILENLQAMQKLSRLPFRQWILPDRISTQGSSSKHLEIPPPLYARGPNFEFSLQKILKDPGSNALISPRESVSNEAIIDQLSARTELDRGQCRALIAALTREFAFIQGPPGTGKSFLGVRLMRVLLDCKRKAHLGPIVVVCYTNHALDQFLENLLDVGIEKILRMGGQSHSTRLEGKNLRVVSQSEGKTKFEGYTVATIYKELEHLETAINLALDELHDVEKRQEWPNFKKHLANNYPIIYSKFSRIDEDGFKTVGREPFDLWRPTGKLLGKLNSSDQSEQANSTSTIQQILVSANANIHSLSQRDRVRLIEHWIQEIREDVADRLYELVKEADGLRKKLANIHDDVDRRVLQTADVIGVTTTGLAKRISTLKHVQCKVVICEEAGEVMEPHMISALLPSVEHFIQIGDHEQLRPQINNYSLSLENPRGLPYQLDRSQFERLSVGERGRPAFPVAQLNVQRRMRPEISRLIRDTIYSRLTDHESTKILPDVVGMRKNVFWLDHDNAEEGAYEDLLQKSHSNVWEADMTHALVRHVVRQGVYNSSDIAVLTPYTGQLQKLRTAMRNDFEIVLSERDEETLEKEGFNAEDSGSEGERTSSQVSSRSKPLEKKKLSELLRIATVDNFQGEEASVIIVSLVRSNKRKKVGFLRTTNRINVLLSRAQHGMYLIGNADTYSDVPMWEQVIGALQSTGSVGKAFGLCCPRHMDIEMEASQPDDFAKLSPEGGCQLACDRRLPDCGHRCQARCHSESMHQVFACPQPCQRLHKPCNHSCQKKTCGEDCGPCMVRWDNIPLPCGHSKNGVQCFQLQDLGKIVCKVLVHRQVPGCKHIVEVPCSRDVSAESFSCPTACKTNLACGHPCPGTCGRCNKKDGDGQPIAKHFSCTKTCGRRFGTCNHNCPKLCHSGSDCGPCFSACEVRCAHSRCTQRCHQACAPCVEKCTWSCEHKGDCTMPCSAPCNRLPCNKRCSRNLSCGHQCPGICGEICPESYCYTCSAKQDARVDMLEFKSYGEIDLDETPIVVLGCGHFFTAETLDGHMGMSEVYTIDALGEFTELRDMSNELAISIPRCPDCQCAVQQYATQRYNRVINRAVIDEVSKRFLVTGKEELRGLELEIKKMEQDLEVSGDEITKSLHPKPMFTYSIEKVTPAQVIGITKKLQERHEKIRNLEKKIKSFRDKVAEENQPAQKLHDATIHAARQRSIDILMADLNVVDKVPAVPRDRRITLGARLAKIKMEHIALVDKFSIAQEVRSAQLRQPEISIKMPGGAPNLLAKLFFQTCRTFINDCDAENLPKLAVEASLYYSRITSANENFCRSTNVDVEHASKHVETAKELLTKAEELCKQPFQNAKELLKAVEQSMKLLRRQWYEEITAEEIAAIKNAMVSGPGGIATHSGHWYNCVNGHPFAIGECGMPMQLARCPECGEPVGGQNHQGVAGVTRAMNMEH